MNPRLGLTWSYPFARLNELLGPEPYAGNLGHIPLSLGEPRHDAPDFVLEALADATALRTDLSSYPPTGGAEFLRESMVAWLQQRFGLPAGALDPGRHVLPVNGTREALFAIAQTVVDDSHRPIVALPDPFYQIYAGAALLAGAEPRYLPCSAATGYLPDLDALTAADWSRCALLYLCSPGNPAGAVMPQEQWTAAFELAERYDIVIVSDECYSEIYPDEQNPPLGALQAAIAAGVDDFHNLVVFNSLSKRSNLPGLRSGLVAGDPSVIAAFLHYRTYHGSAMPPATQRASALAWSDERHVVANRELYRRKFEAVVPILSPFLPVEHPGGGFYLWPTVPGGDDQAFARDLRRSTNVTVLPGSFLSRPGSHAPGLGHVRIALVAEYEACLEGATRLAEFVGRAID